MLFIEKQWKMILGILVLILIIGAASVIQSTIKLSKEKKTQESFFVIEKKYNDFKNKKNKDLNPSDKKSDKKAVVSPADLATELIDEQVAIKKELEKFISENTGSKATQMAAIYYAEILKEEKNNDLALVTLQKVQTNDHGLVNTLVQQQIGQILADANKCQEAIDSWQKIIERKEAEFLHNNIKIQQALCYQKMNNLKKAEELLTNIANQKSEGRVDSASVKEAARYLRLIQFKKVSGT